MSTQSTTPDGFLFTANNPRATSHRQQSDYLQDPKASTLPADSAKFEKPEQLALLCAALERADFQKRNRKQVNTALSELIKKLSGRKLPYTEESLVQAAAHSANVLMPEDPDHIQWSQLDSPLPGVTPALLDAIEALTKEKPLSKEVTGISNAAAHCLATTEILGRQQEVRRSPRSIGRTKTCRPAG